jgi:hypothetical protein
MIGSGVAGVQPIEANYSEVGLYSLDFLAQIRCFSDPAQAGSNAEFYNSCTPVLLQLLITCPAG